MQLMMCVLSKEVPEGLQWIYERKFDGMRCFVEKKGKTVTLYSRNNQNLTSMYPELLAALSKQTVKSCMLDGEIVAFDKKQTSFTKLQERMFVRNPSATLQKKIKIYFYAFDLLELNGKDITKKPLTERKQLLKKYIMFGGPLRYTTHKSKNGDAELKKACSLGWEGIIAKDKTSTYQHVRSPSWQKIKCLNNQELVIGGYTKPSGSRTGFGALLLGYYEKKGSKKVFRYAGKVGTGFSDKTLTMLIKKLSPLKRTTSPFVDYSESIAGVYWVQPVLVAQIGFAEWTRAGLLRQARYQGLREDKPALKVTREDKTDTLAAVKGAK